jgi:hypothetical protein
MLAQAQMAGTPQTPFHATVAPTDVEKAYNDYNNTMMQAYQAKVGQQNAMWGGLAGLGGAGLLALGGGGGLSKLLGGSFSPGDIAAIGQMPADQISDAQSAAYGKAMGLD